MEEISESNFLPDFTYLQKSGNDEANRPLTARQLMAIHIGTLYRLEDGERLLAINESGFPTAPRFYMGRTAEGNLWRVRHDLPADVVAQIDTLCRTEAIATDLANLPQNYEKIRAVLAQHQPIQREYRGPAYWIPPLVPQESLQSTQKSANVVLINAANAQLLQPFFASLLGEDPYHELGPVAVVVQEGCAVAACFCARIPGLASEAGVNTEEEFRRKGYATAVVIAWADALRQQGCIPLYSTWWGNLASQGVARKLGMVCYGDDWSVD